MQPVTNSFISLVFIRPRPKFGRAQISISLTKEEKKQFEKLYKEETRGVTTQFKHMMKFYINNKDKVK